MTPAKECQGTTVRGQRTEIRSQRTEVRKQKAGEKSRSWEVGMLGCLEAGKLKSG